MQPFLYIYLIQCECGILIRTNLEIKVSYFSGVKVVHPLQDLLDELSGFFFAQRLFLGQEVKQLTSRDPETQISLIIQLPVL